MAGYGKTRSLVLLVSRTKRAVPAADIDILITGTFYSDNWILTHLLPMARSSACRRVRMVASTPVPPMDKVEAIYPPAWLCRLIGGVPARLLVFIWLGLRDRPHVVGGFHLLLNGLVAGLLGRVIGARTLYICGGGPREVLGGGYLTENKLFNKIGEPDSILERHLLAAVRDFDIVITMGSSAVRFFKQWDTVNRYYTVPGGFDGACFSPAETEPSTDIILVGRLSAVKRVDTFLRAVALVKLNRPGVKAMVVGDGPDRQALEALAADLGLAKNVSFVGWQNNVEHWLRLSRIFSLTSDFEGLSQAMIQAMLCGLPVVVSDVGDSSDLVMHGINGYLVKNRSPEDFASCYEKILSDPARWQSMSKSSRQISERHDVKNVSLVWDDILAGMTPDELASKHGFQQTSSHRERRITG